jgi:Uma2 family endonuclease
MFVVQMESEEAITDYAKLDLSGTYTYPDYLHWHFKERVELIRGKVFKISPAPNTNHQLILANLGRNFLNFFREHSCIVFFGPFDVRLPIAKPGKDYTVVQTDICVICDESKLDKQGCKDAPDLVVEILSPGNSRHEMQTKFELYEEAGVREYWIVEPEKKWVLVYSLYDNKYIGSKPYVEGDTVRSSIFKDFTVKVDELYGNLHNA